MLSKQQGALQPVAIHKQNTDASKLEPIWLQSYSIKTSAED